MTFAKVSLHELDETGDLLGFPQREYECQMAKAVKDEKGNVKMQGKRIFKKAPIHHHFQLCGWSEKKIVLIFAGITVIMCVLAYFGTAPHYL